MELGYTPILSPFFFMFCFLREGEKQRTTIYKKKERKKQKTKDYVRWNASAA